jgi:lysozyme
MRPSQQVSRAAIDLVKRFEGYRRKAARLPDGRWTIGYGHTLSAREGAEVSESDAEALLIYDLRAVAGQVEGLVYAPLTQNQFDALCAFAFSVGAEAFRGSEVLKRVNEGAAIQASFALELWRRSEFEGESLVIDALVRRRAAEKLLFLTPPGDAWPTAPSAILRPALDRVTRDRAPAGEPVLVTASLQGAAVELAREPAAAPASPVVAAAAALTERLDTLFPEPVAAAPPTAEAQEPDSDGDQPMPRILIDDTAPYEFIAPPVRPLAAETDNGPLVIAVLILAGLAFFAGGIFWAFNAEPGGVGDVFTPLLVGWLAGVAGVGFIGSAVFMLLQRLGRAAEGRDRRG